MKVFISQGLRDKEKDMIDYERQQIQTYIQSQYEEKCEFNKLLNDEIRERLQPAQCLACSIFELAQSDKVYIPNDYSYYNGCTIEQLICDMYKIQYEIYDIDDICYGTFDDYKEITQ